MKKIITVINKINNKAKTIKNYIIYLIVKGVFLLSKILPIWIISNFFAIIATILSPLIPHSKIAIKNMKNLWPHLTFKKRYIILFKLWFNLGKFAGEFPYVYSMNKNKFKQYVESSNKTLSIINEIKNNKNGSILFSGHFANWEFGLRYLCEQGLKINVIYRKLNNDFIEKRIIQKLRNNGQITMIAKQENAALRMVKALKKKEIVLVLVDQRDDKGLLVDLINKPAYTTDSVATIAKKLNCPIYPFRTIRHGLNTKFTVEAKPKIETYNVTVKSITKNINAIIGNWITEYPYQWFLVHNRWKINHE